MVIIIVRSGFERECRLNYRDRKFIVPGQTFIELMQDAIEWTQRVVACVQEFIAHAKADIESAQPDIEAAQESFERVQKGFEIAQAVFEFVKHDIESAQGGFEWTQLGIEWIQADIEAALPDIESCESRVKGRRNNIRKLSPKGLNMSSPGCSPGACSIWEGNPEGVECGVVMVKKFSKEQPSYSTPSGLTSLLLPFPGFTPRATHM